MARVPLGQLHGPLFQILPCKPAPSQCWSPVRGHGRQVLAVEKQQPHSLVLRSGTPRVNTASGELFAHSHTIYYWEPHVKDMMIFRA